MEEYKLLNKLGSGSYGQVFLAEKKVNKSQYVIKEIKVSHFNSDDLEEARKEVLVLSRLVHNHITKFFNSFEGHGSLFIVMEYCAGGDLQKLIESRNDIYFPEDRILDWFVQLCLAVNFIHRRYIMHRDIKTQNIFLTDEGKIKLGDFGIAKILDKTSDLANTCIGTPYYLSPEMCENRPYSNKSDIWAVGCVLYELMTLKHAFMANNIKSLIIRIIRCSYQPLPPRYSRNLKLLIEQIFQRDPKLRPSVCTILSKQFISKKLPRFMTSEDAKELKINAKKKLKSATTSGKRKIMRSRIGITSPSAKYGIPPKMNISFPNIPTNDKSSSTATETPNHSKLSINSVSIPKNRDSSCSESLACQHPLKIKQVKKRLSNFCDLKNSQTKKVICYRKNSVSYLESGSSKNSNYKYHSNCNKSEFQMSPKLNLIMKESKTSFRKIDVSDSILCNLEKSLKTSDLQNSELLVDLYLSKKLIDLKNDLKSSNFLSESIQKRVNCVVNNEFEKVCQMANERRKSAYSDYRNSYESCHQTFSPIEKKNPDEDDIFLSKRYNTPRSFLDLNCMLTPMQKRMKWEPAATPVFAKYPIEMRASNAYETEILNEIDHSNRKQWSSGPQDIVNILSAIKLVDGHQSLGRKNSQCIQISQPTSFNDDLKCTKEVIKEVEPSNETDYLKRLSCFCIGEERKLKTPKRETSDMGLLSIKTPNETDLLPHNENIKCISNVKDNDLDIADISISLSDTIDDAKSETTNTKKSKKRFFSFLQSKTPLQGKAIKPQPSFKEENNRLSTAGSKARFSFILKKFLQRESQSKSPICKVLKTDFESVSSTKTIDNTTELDFHLDHVPFDEFINDSVFSSKLEINLGQEQKFSDNNGIKTLTSTEDSGLETFQTNFSSIQIDNKENEPNSLESLATSCGNTADEFELDNTVKYISGLQIQIKANSDVSNTASNKISYPQDIPLSRHNNNHSISKFSKINNFDDLFSTKSDISTGTGTQTLNDSTLALNQNRETSGLAEESIRKTAFDLVQNVFQGAIKNLEEKNFISTKDDNSEKFISFNDSNHQSYAKSRTINAISTPLNKYCHIQKKPQTSSVVWDKINNLNKSELDIKSSPVYAKVTITNKNDDTLPENLFLKHRFLKDDIVPLSSKSSISEGEAEEVKNFRESLENLLSIDEYEDVFEYDNPDKSFSTADVPNTPDGDIHGWIEEQREKFESLLGLKKFIEAYRCLEEAFEQNDSSLKTAMLLAKSIVGSEHEEMVPKIFQLILFESVHLQ